MIPAEFPQINSRMKAPDGFDESQVSTIGAYGHTILGGSMDGCTNVVVAWKPTEREIELIRQGKPIFISFIGGVPPHYPSMSFEEATHSV